MGQHISTLTPFQAVVHWRYFIRNWLHNFRTFRTHWTSRIFAALCLFLFDPASTMIIVITQGCIPGLVPFPSPQHNFHVHSHLWPQLKFMKSPQCWGLLGRRLSQEPNELIVTRWLLLSISELSTAVDRRCPGPHPSITGPPIIRRQNK